MTVGQEIRRRREEKGWSQAKLGVESGLGPSGISQIETGRRNPSAASLQKIAEALEVEVRDLFPLAQPPLPETQEYSALLEEMGFSPEQIASWQAQEERDNEAIARKLENMSAKDFLEQLMSTSPALRRYHRDNPPQKDAPPRSESA